MTDFAALTELFPDGDYRLHLTLRRSPPAEFFRPMDPGGAVRAERAYWIAAERDRYVRLDPDAQPALEEFCGEAAGWGIACRPDPGQLAVSFDCDVLFLTRDAAGDFRLRGGALCFPTGWALEEKLGQTLDAIHGVVPGLNPALGAPIRQFLARMKPGVAFHRDNWGLAGTSALNLHPARQVPPPGPSADLSRLWLRVEHQALLTLSRSGGVVFGIRIALHRLDTLVGTPVAPRLAHALETMPPELAAYKRIGSLRLEVAHRLRSHSPFHPNEPMISP